MRPYNKRSGVLGPVPIRQSVNDGGWGELELSARFSHLDLTDGTIEGGEMSIFSLGANWWLSRAFNTNLNFRTIRLDRYGLEGTSSGLAARILLLLE